MNKYPYEAGIYDSWISAKSIKTLLDSKDIDYHLQQALPYDFIWENKKVLRTNQQINYSDLVLDYLRLLDNRVSLDDWVQDNYDFEKDRIVWQDINEHDGHPTMKHHLDFVKEFFPQYITEKTIRVEIQFDRETAGYGGSIQIHSEVVDTLYEKK